MLQHQRLDEDEAVVCQAETDPLEQPRNVPRVLDRFNPKHACERAVVQLGSVAAEVGVVLHVHADVRKPPRFGLRLDVLDLRPRIAERGEVQRRECRSVEQRERPAAEGAGRQEGWIGEGIPA